ncbi:unnamed protein product [Tenebrio molitor]|nr:unnamed protein product [Tenebrio molitor]
MIVTNFETPNCSFVHKVGWMIFSSYGVVQETRRQPRSVKPPRLKRKFFLLRSTNIL